MQLSAQCIICSFKRAFLSHISKRCLTTSSPTADALVYSSHGNPSKVLRFHKHTLPNLTAESLHLRFLASPVNPADINQIEGTYPLRPPFIKQLSTSEPVAVGGNEGVAEVIAVGKNVDGVKVGDWVVMAKAGFGTWRTHAVAKPNDVQIIPKDAINVLQAATLAVNPCTAYRMLKDFADLEQGDFIIQNGANSGVGQAVIQVAQAQGIRTINIVRNRPEIDDLKSLLQSIGATYVLTDDELNKPSTRENIVEWTQGKSIKLGLNCVGGKTAVDMARYIGDGGYHITYGAMSRQPLTIPASLLIFRNIRFCGFWVTKWSEQHGSAERAAMFTDLIRLIERGELREPQITEVTWPVENGNGQDLMEAIGRTMDGFGKKIVLRMK